MLLRYILYLITCIIIVELLCYVCFSSSMTILEFVKYVLPDWVTFLFVIPGTIALTCWYGGSKVVSIEYNEDKKKFTIQYYNILFCLKQIQIPENNLQFQVYHILTPFLFSFVTIIRINDSGTNKKVSLSSGLGWKRKRIIEIAEKMKLLSMRKKLDIQQQKAN